MIKYTPIPVEEHSKLLGENFAQQFAKEMFEYYRPFVKKERPIQVAKEAWEYAVADAIPDGVWIGAGKNIVDVQTPSLQLDVKGLSCNKWGGKTTEASVLQNHQSEHDNTYMVFFENNQFDGLYDIYVQALLNKISTAENLHVLCAIRDKKAKQAYYVLFRVDAVDITKEQFVSQMYKQGGRKIIVPMIDPEIGSTYIYIPKRRLEIRLNTKNLKNYAVFSHSYSINEYV
jgi:hypothetical protein